jgi:phospholipid/cholesterol/gamma-HCH transport system substrate-binding protein
VSRRSLVTVAIIGVLVTLVIVVRGGGSDPYTLRMRLADAGGLRSGSPVTVGGLQIGTVGLGLQRDHVDVTLHIDKQHAPLGRNATAAIVAQNLLGQKQVRVTYGDRSNPAPDNYTILARQISPTTDLDQLLATLDPDTRGRLAILLNETGEALDGRKLDLATVLRTFPPAMQTGSELFQQLMADNRALGNLVQVSDRFVGTLAGDRRNLAHTVDQLGKTTETVAARHTALAETLRRAPAALASARAFLMSLRATAQPLGRTARQLTTAAPPLTTALERLPAFQKSASPALATAASVSPALVTLGRGATPVLREAVPVLAAVRSLSTGTLPGVGSTLDESTDNILAVLENWSRAIQFSDGLSHIFRGEASIAPDLYRSAIARLVPKSQRGRQPSRQPHLPKPSGSAAPVTERPPALPEAKLPLGSGLPAVVKKALEALPKGVLTQQSNDGDGAHALLDYLLGGKR